MADESTDEPQGLTEEELELFKKFNIGTEGGLPLPKFIKPSEVVSTARDHAEQIFGDWAVLKALVERHEEALHDRWKAMKKKKRRDMLVAAWPDMPLVHRPDVVAMRAHETDGNDVGDNTTRVWTEKDKSAFMWPAVNVEDLSKTTRPLWLMMRSRGRNAPDVFSEMDLDSIRLGKACLALQPRYLNKYSMVFVGRTTPEKYGQLYPWTGLSDEEQDELKSYGRQPGDGLFILEIQAALYAFLREMAQQVLGSALLATPVSSQVMPKALDEDTVGLPSDAEFHDLPTQESESFYRTPRGMDLQRLLDYTFARLGEAEDHVWALCEDPVYFAATLREWRDHRRELVSTTTGELHPLMAGPSLAFWKRIMEQSVRRALEQVETWHILYAKVRLVASQMEKHAKSVDGLKLGQPLPKDLALSFYSLVNHLRSLESEPVGNLQVGAFASPPLRQYFRLKVPSGAEGENNDDLTLVPAPESEAASRGITKEVIWALEKLQDDGGRQLLGSRTLLDAIEHAVTVQLDDNPGATSHANRTTLLSSWVAAELSSLALYDSFAGEVARFQPWARDFESAMRETETAEVLQMDFHMSMNRLRPLLQFGFRERVVSLGVPDDGRFDNADVVAAEAALDLFWSKLKASMEKHNALTKRVEVLFENLPRRPEPGAKPKEVKVTRKKIHVDKRSAKVFRAVFWDPRSEVAKSNVPAEVPWLDFVHAMHSVGFEVTRLYGSAWLFLPKTVASKGRSPNIFREPWSTSNKIPLISARWIGKRLNKAYGWDKNTFDSITA